MTPSVLTWTVLAGLLFWAVGAYNRLMRLRAEAHAAFGSLDAELGRQVDLVRTELPVERDEGARAPATWLALHAAATQLGAVLASARQRPLDPERTAALGSAQEVLAAAWTRAERHDAHDMAGPHLPEEILPLRAQQAMQSHAAAEQFNRAVERYNEAISQFPALLLAWLFGFKPAGAMTHVIGPSLG